MISCGREGRPDLYGLGIRLGIYFQWFGEMLVEFFDQPDVSDIRLLGFLLSGAIVLALLVQIADQRVQGADIYIMLQLAAGSYIFLVPMYIWKALTCCDRRWDPLRQTREANMAVFNASTMVLLVIISALHLWLFSTYMPTKGRQCGYYGFFFAKVKLDNTAYVVINIIVGQEQRPDETEQERNARRERARQHRADLLRTMRGISNLLVYGLHITAIELTIRWNQFDNIDGVDTSAQTVPLLVSAGILARFLLLHYEGRNDDASAAGGRQPVNPGEGPEQDAGGQNHDQDQADPNAEMVDLDDFVAGIDLDNDGDPETSGGGDGGREGPAEGQRGDSTAGAGAFKSHDGYSRLRGREGQYEFEMEKKRDGLWKLRERRVSCKYLRGHVIFTRCNRYGILVVNEQITENWYLIYLDQSAICITCKPE
ncbi:hypothetical protein HDV57DRAFT_511593 [Trichoderma longibrachiatum]|uniref:Uncharacterized protein n=1 Tax=Trichoderma longibrachiatum ATCC 18648 TaxID=983965 RepID=A0A2T4BPR1_TRILO|nr:hypothetical protein M440DRAFT_1386909 [Trichoderma longibrachiatum ATCC 18648]